MLHKAFRIIEVISSKKVATIKDISTKTNIPRSTVHRILQVLVEENIVVLNARKGYTLTTKLVSLGLDGVTWKGLLDYMAPVMRDISDKTKETVSLNVVCGHERVCIYRVEGDFPIMRNVKVGDRGPLFLGSVGKVFAATLNPEKRKIILEQYQTDGIITKEDVPLLMEQLKKVEKQGYAVSIGERIENSASIAVPIKDISGYTLATLSISTIAERLNEENKIKFLELLLNATAPNDTVQIGSL